VRVAKRKAAKRKAAKRKAAKRKAARAIRAAVRTLVEVKGKGAFVTKYVSSTVIAVTMCVQNVQTFPFVMKSLLKKVGRRQKEERGATPNG